MASKTGMFLDDEERARLIRGLESHGEVQRSHVAPLGNDTGCLICGNDDDHNNLMLCEGCNDEYHTYCLDPPLPAVPADDWFCGE
jgi:PHD-finger